MPEYLLHFTTAALWLALGVIVWRAASPAAPAPGVTPMPDEGAGMLPSLLLPLALALHGVLLYKSMATADGLDLGLANAVSLIVWLTLLIYWFAGLAYPGMAKVQGLLAPAALAALAFQTFSGTRHVVGYFSEPLFALHFAVAMLAYALYIVATLHALIMLAEEKFLRRGSLPPLLRQLPPLMQMEALLFRILFSAFVLLSLTLVTGVFFSEELFHKPFSFNHKTVFGIISWLIFGGLLVGHHYRGWRGRLAVNWTLAGFTALLFAYVGSKFVLEILLKR
jgi:ABC-type uncharacterized transport system permease subunit